MEVVGWSCGNVSSKTWSLIGPGALVLLPTRELASQARVVTLTRNDDLNPKQSFVLAREPHNLSFEYEHAKETPLVGSTLSRFIPSTRN